MTEIGAYAFRNTNLKSITFPKSVTTIGDYAFDIDELTEVHCLWNTPPEIEIECEYYSRYESGYSIYSKTWATPFGLYTDEDETYYYDDHGAYSEYYSYWGSYYNSRLMTLYVPYGCSYNYKTKEPWKWFYSIREE